MMLYVRKIAPAVLMATIYFLNESARAGQPVVVCEEVVTRTTPANNGAGPLWCYGSPLVVRVGESVYLSTIETGQGIPPLCNTRWQLWGRDGDGWRVMSQEREFRQREPCPLASLEGGLFLSANPSTQPPGTQYGRCQPTVFRFSERRPAAPPASELPSWSGQPHFTDHSYRGLAADRQSGELLLLNIDASTSEQLLSHRDKTGVWRARGKIRFPIRAAYPQVALRDGAAHVLAVGDIREPIERWRKLKREKLQRDWDYVFRRLFYTFTNDLSGSSFTPPLELDSVEETAGHLTNLDLHVDRDGAAHVLYLKRPHLHEFLRDAFFPGQPMTTSLEYAVIQGGRVAARNTLASTAASGSKFEPAYARFHAGPAGRLYVVMAGALPGDGGASRWVNLLQRIAPAGGDVQEILLQSPLRRFFVSAPRGGGSPSMTIDLYGQADDAPNLRYAAIELRE